MGLGVLREAIAGARGVYEQRASSHPALLLRRKGRASKRRGTKPHVYSVKRKRSDRAEAHARSLAFFFARCSLETLEVGQWQDGAIAYYDLGRLADALGLSPWRLDRAISDLVAAGYIYRHQTRDLVAEITGPRFCGHVGKLKLTLKAFEACGVPRARLDLYRRRVRERAARQAEARDRRRPAAPVGTLISKLIDPAVRDLRPELPEQDAAYVAIALEVRREHPTWPPEIVREEASRRRRKPPDSR